MSWLAPVEVCKVAIDDGKLIKSDQVQVRADYLAALLDERVVLDMVRRFFTTDAWNVMLTVVNELNENFTYCCVVCKLDCKKDACISCACRLLLMSVVPKSIG